MYRPILALLLILGVSPLLIAQGVTRPGISCYAEKGKENQAFKKKLWDGYEVSLGPARNSQGDGDECTAVIYNAAGKVVYRTTGFNVIFDEEQTGKDVDGDGHPEVFFRTDTGGGMHCCWEFNVVSLSPRPHKLFDLPQPGGIRFEMDRQGKMAIWTNQPGPYGFTSNANAPFAAKVFRFREGKLADATPEFCEQILKDPEGEFVRERKLLTPERAKQFQVLAALPTDEDDTASAALSIALQLVFCRQFEQARAALEVWPQTEKAKMKASFAAAIKDDYPEFAVSLVK